MSTAVVEPTTTVVEPIELDKPVVHGVDVLLLPPKALKPSATNPRSKADDWNLQELADSIEVQGVLQPLIVRAVAGDRFEIIAGERRYQAAKLARLSEIPCRIVQASDEEAADIQLVENLQRSDIHPLDEAEGYAKMYGACGSIQQIAKRVSKPVFYVQRRMQLNSLTQGLKKAFRERKLIPAHAFQLCRFPAAVQKEMAQVIGKSDLTPNQVREMILRQHALKLAEAPFKTTDATLVPGAGSCADCLKRTGANPALFSDIKAKDTCTDAACFRSKLDAHLGQIAAAIEKETGHPAVKIACTWRPTGEGVIGENHWREAEGPKACPHVQKGIVVEADSYGSGPKRLWKVLTVCIAEKVCKVHFPHGAGYHDESDEQRKARESAQRAAQKRKRETNQAVWAAVQEHFPKAMGSDELRILARQLYHRVFGPYRIRIARDLYKLEATAKQRNSASHFEDGMREKLEGMTGPELSRFVLLCLTVENALGTPYDFGMKGGEPDNPLYQLAHAYTVDTKTIRAGIAAAAKEKAAKRSKTNGKAKPVTSKPAVN